MNNLLQFIVFTLQLSLLINGYIGKYRESSIRGTRSSFNSFNPINSFKALCMHLEQSKKKAYYQVKQSTEFKDKTRKLASAYSKSKKQSNSQSNSPSSPSRPANQTWRLYNIEISISIDPGKDTSEVFDSLLASIAMSLGLIDKGPLDIQHPVKSQYISLIGSEDYLAYLKPIVRVIRKSFDGRIGRNGDLYFSYIIDVDLPLNLVKALKLREKIGKLVRYEHEDRSVDYNRETISKAKRSVIVVGAGPSGLFAAIELCKAGFQPIIIDRGQPVEIRGRDIGALFNRKILNPNSNLCYGEGGAGTWSDGKLTTRIGKNSDDVRTVLQTLVSFGAPNRILVDGKPHLGTDRLVKLLQNLRADLISQGAQFVYNATVVDIIVETVNMEGTDVSKKIKGVSLNNGTNLYADDVILAIGHSSRAMYETLLCKGVQIEPKGIAVGFRIEHPQDLINRIQYGSFGSLCLRGEGKIPVADYRLTANALSSEHESINNESDTLSDTKTSDASGDSRSCYSFCMCPGGQIGNLSQRIKYNIMSMFVVPTSVDPEYLCINGMSFSKRQSPWANSAIVVTISPEDMIAIGGNSPLRGMIWQQHHEHIAAIMGGGNLVAPVQRVPDFLAGNFEKNDGHSIRSSYRLGVKESPCHEIYPSFVTEALRSALKIFDQRMPGFICEEAILHGVETRTSSPVQITRDPNTCQSVTISNLYPSGEGAGYAGGIISAAVDGMKVARAIISETLKSYSMQTDIEKNEIKNRS